MKINTKEDKWLLLSCLQKSIRKGFEALAISYAEKLYDLDENYLIYKLSIIALEDIGLADLDLVNEFLMCQNKKEIVDSKGGKKYVLQIVSKFTKSIKDRTILELTELTHLSPNLNISDTHQLEDIFINDSHPLVNRLMAGWELLDSKKFKNPLIKNKEEDIENFIKINSYITQDDKILNILKNAYIIYKEPHFIGLGLLSKILGKEQDIKIGIHKTNSVVEKVFIEKLILNKWLIDGVDWHTKEGKSAIQDFIFQKPSIVNTLKKLGVNNDNLSNVIGMLMFRYTGHEVNKRLIYPSAVLILKLNQQKCLEKMVNNKNIDFKNTIKLFMEDYSILEKNIENVFKNPDPKYFPF